jgi:hypothetical protein
VVENGVISNGKYFSENDRPGTNRYRDKTLLIAHVVLACILGVFAGGLYYQVGVTIAGFQNRVGSLFFLGSLIAFSSLRYVKRSCGMCGLGTD